MAKCQLDGAAVALLQVVVGRSGVNDEPRPSFGAGRWWQPSYLGSRKGRPPPYIGGQTMLYAAGQTMVSRTRVRPVVAGNQREYWRKASVLVHQCPVASRMEVSQAVSHRATGYCSDSPMADSHAYGYQAARAEAQGSLPQGGRFQWPMYRPIIERVPKTIERIMFSLVLWARGQPVQLGEL